jgi:predicted ABC-type transport system involved in lysophospholipase L1 biosynthesis ATPase subunit
VLEARGLVKSYRAPAGPPIRALDGVDLRVAAGCLAVVVGASGSGKSTLLNVLGLLEDADQGEIVIGGESVSALRRSARSRVATSRSCEASYRFCLESGLWRTSSIRSHSRAMGQRETINTSQATQRFRKAEKRTGSVMAKASTMK